MDVSLAGIGPCHADVAEHGVVEQVHILEHGRDQAVQVGGWQAADVHAADADRAALRIGVPHQQARQRGLAGARRAHQRGQAARRQIQVDIAQGWRTAAGVAEFETVDTDARRSARAAL